MCVEFVPLFLAIGDPLGWFLMLNSKAFSRSPPPYQASLILRCTPTAPPAGSANVCISPRDSAGRVVNLDGFPGRSFPKSAVFSFFD